MSEETPATKIEDELDKLDREMELENKKKKEKKEKKEKEEEKIAAIFAVTESTRENIIKKEYPQIYEIIEAGNAQEIELTHEGNKIYVFQFQVLKQHNSLMKKIKEKYTVRNMDTPYSFKIMNLSVTPVEKIKIEYNSGVGWSTQFKSTFEKAVEDSGIGDLYKRIYLRGPSSHGLSILNKDLQVSFAFTPDHNGGDTLRTYKAYGVSVGDYFEGCPPWSMADYIITTEGLNIASGNRNNLFIHTDLQRNHDRAGFINEVRHILTEIFKKAIIEIQQIDKPVTPEMLNKQCEQFLKFCEHGITKKINTAKTELARFGQEIELYNKQLVAAVRNSCIAQKTIDRLAHFSSEDVKSFEKEYRAMLSAPKIKRIRTHSLNQVRVMTDTLLVTNPNTNEVHELGKYEIYINFDSGDVRMYNLDRTVKSYEGREMHAPHVFNDGKPCRGNLDTILPSLIGNYEFAATVSVLIQFLESVNLDDSAGRGITHWPLKAELDAKRKREEEKEAKREEKREKEQEKVATREDRDQ